MRVTVISGRGKCLGIIDYLPNMGEMIRIRTDEGSILFHVDKIVHYSKNHKKILVNQVREDNHWTRVT